MLIFLQAPGAELGAIRDVIDSLGGLPVIVAVTLLLGAFPIIFSLIQAARDKHKDMLAAQERRERDQLFVQSTDRQAQAGEKTAEAIEKLANVMAQGQVQRAGESAQITGTLKQISDTQRDLRNEMRGGFDRLHTRMDEIGGGK